MNDGYRSMRQPDGQTAPEQWKLTISFCLRLVSVVVLLFAAWGVFYATHGGTSVTLDETYQMALQFKEMVNSNYWKSVVVFILTYIVLSAGGLPVSVLLTMGSGFLFGTAAGAFYVLTAAVVSAMVSFYTGRYLMGLWIQHRWQHRLNAFNENLSLFGAEYLITIRLIPMMPFSLVNTLAGITKIAARVFAWTTAMGILPGVIIFSYLGQSLPEIKSMDDIWSRRAVIILLLMRLLLFVAVWIRFSILKKNLVSA